jgi:titin
LYISGSKCIDPDTGLIYFKYDFGYEVGLVLPGEGKNMNVGPAQPSVRPQLQLPDDQSEVEFPIIHERTEEVKHAKKIRWESESELSDFEHQRAGKRMDQRAEPSPSSVSTASPAQWTVQPGESGSKLGSAF